MKFSETNAYRARAANCRYQADLNTDAKLKKYWEDLADDWLALADVVVEKDRRGKVMH
jgi:hypothetical protein